MEDWTWTRAGRRFRQRLADSLSHEAWRALIRETYPARLDRVGPDWMERFGQEVDWTATALYDEARREAWARRTVRAAGKSWATHMAKFSGAVVERESVLPPLPDPWADRPTFDHYDVASAEARQGRRGLLDSGPHAPRRKGRGIASGWADEEDYGPRYT